MQLTGEYNKITQHFRYIHGIRTSGDSLVALVCPGCNYSYSSWPSYRFHLMSCNQVIRHINRPNEGLSAVWEVLEGPPYHPHDVEDPIIVQGQVQEDNNPFPAYSDQSEDKIDDKIENKISLMFFNLKAKFNVSHEGLNFICQEFKSVLSPIENTEVKSIRSSLEKLKSKKRRTTFFKTHFGLFHGDELNASNRFNTRIDAQGQSLPYQESNNTS